MGETRSSSHETSAEIRNWLAAIAALIAFCWFGYEYNTAQNKLATATASLAEKTADDQARKAQFDAIQSQLAAMTAAATAKDEIANKRFAVEQAAFEQTERSSPSIRVLPELIQSTSYKGVRELSLETEITNIGRVEANVRQIKVNVSTGQAAAVAFDKISRTQQLYDIEQQLNRYSSGTTDPTSTLQQQWNELHSECPHGCIFALAEKSKDVAWTPHPDKSWTCNVDMRLAPKGSASQVFPYVLTESRYHNTSWIRFNVEVSLDVGSSQNFQFVVPFARQSEFLAANFTSTRLSPGDRETSTPLRFRPRSPLAPIRAPESSEPLHKPTGAN